MRRMAELWAFTPALLSSALGKLDRDRSFPHCWKTLKEQPNASSISSIICSLIFIAYSKMIDEKNSIDMVDQKKAPHVLSTIDGDVALEDLVIEDRERKEKALLRKVDTRMMPLMMVLCRSSNGSDPTTNILIVNFRYSQLPGPEQHCDSSSRHVRKGSWSCRQAIQHHYQYLLCG
jgi:hypothetical protein